MEAPGDPGAAEMSRRRRQQTYERPPSPQWPLEVAFWALVIGVLAYLVAAHQAHVWGFLQWALLAASVVATAFWLIRRRQRRTTGAPGTSHHRNAP